LNRQELDPVDLNHINALYDGEIAFIDREIWTLLQALADTGILDESLILFTSDHGEDLYEHNKYFYHAASVYNSTLEIPFFLSAPVMPFPAGVVPVLTQSIDIAPTALNLMGEPPHPDFQGRDLKSALDRTVMVSTPAFSEWEEKILTVRTHSHRYIYNPLNFHPLALPKATRDHYPIGLEELYDLASDPREQRNLADDPSSELDQLRNLISAWKSENGWKAKAGEHSSLGIEEDTRKRLQLLGYVMY
jgi:arylsulfatase A-like enzyme